ncbi:type II secretion system protein GspC [Marinimicrobium sp. ABcell2]|uniref:type II secretion system protein GspC n=1 Tax=Marinimicrobium sp. ABcell2 TaxID=3069751 RepID=UPI0027B68ABF|nr:type II secretion system protein GspC [Marinimicrobium sp. ABcell2]MDQ2076664.1 type II secretion system protein GspC [Marinimicrobium sp. ABcell2]
MQQDRSAAVLDTRSQRLSQLARRSATFFKQIPPAVWRLLAVFLLVIWLAHSLARLIWLVIPEPQLPEAQVAANALASDTAAGGVRRVDIDALKQVQVFGRVDEAAVAEIEAPNLGAPGIEDEAVDTQLRLRLQGIIDSSDERSGRAVIANGSRQALYAPGDELPEGRNVTLEKILPQRVILNNNGRYESLWLYQESDFVNRQTSRRDEPVRDAPSRSWEGDETELTGADEPMDDAMNDHAVGPEEAPEPEAQSAVDQVSRSLSDVVSMSIHREGGQIVGYQIRPGRDSAMFESLGLESGDIVKAVNGTELTSPQRVMELYRNMGNATSASLLIERNGQEVTVDIDLE